MSDLLLVLMGINLAAAAATALVMALRLSVRRVFGARIAYGLWALVPLTAVAMLLPARVVTLTEAPEPARVWEAAAAAPPGPPPAGGLDPWLILTGLWIAGALASVGWLAWRQLQFGDAVRDRRAGPAVIGVLRPRVVTPDDFDRRYTPRERLVVLAHERTHIARHDSRINAAVALVRCVNWFNPAVHVLAHYLRIDQEFACDAQVVAAHPTARRSYAEAMLKTQLAARPLPLGCYWPAQSAHPLAQRIRLLSEATPGPRRRRLGACAVAVLGLAGGWSAWAARPAAVVMVPAAAAPASAPDRAPAASTPAPVAPPAPLAPPAKARVDAVARLPGLEKVTPAPEPSLVLAAFSRLGAEPTPTPTPTPTPEPTPRPFAWDGPAKVSKIHAVARRSAVEPGSAVRVLATMVDRDGVPLTTDLTAFGSQTAYRTGYFNRKGSRYALFTAVRQTGDRFWVMASLDRDFRPETSGSVVLASGQAGQITLGDGQVVTVTPTLRPETPDEIVDAQRIKAEQEAWRRVHDDGRPRVVDFRPIGN